MDNISEKRIARIAIIMILLILILSIVAIWHSNFMNSHKKMATIYQNGIAIYTFDLEQVHSPQELTIAGENGSYNTILVEPGCISMKNASCPDHLCVNMGRITTPTLPITCLPNKVVISISDVDTDAPDSFAY